MIILRKPFRMGRKSYTLHISIGTVFGLGGYYVRLPHFRACRTYLLFVCIEVDWYKD